MQEAKFFDSHIHLNSEELEKWFSKVFNNYSDWVFNNVSTNLEDFHTALQQSKEHKNVFVTAGIHPLEINDLEISSTVSEIDRYINGNSKVIAIGETGLDFYRVSKERAYDKQRIWLMAQYELAKKYNLPLVLHIRNAHEEMLDLLNGIIDWYGVIHCYDGNLETAKRYLSAKGKWMISISPVVFRSTSFVKTIIKDIDIKRLLVETDSPFLANNNEQIREIIKLIAEEKDMDFEEVKKILWENFCEFFRLKL